MKSTYRTNKKGIIKTAAAGAAILAMNLRATHEAHAQDVPDGGRPITINTPDASVEAMVPPIRAPGQAVVNERLWITPLDALDTRNGNGIANFNTFLTQLSRQQNTSTSNGTLADLLTLGTRLRREIELVAGPEPDATNIDARTARNNAIARYGDGDRDRALQTLDRALIATIHVIYTRVRNDSIQNRNITPGTADINDETANQMRNLALFGIARSSVNRALYENPDLGSLTGDAGSAVAGRLFAVSQTRTFVVGANAPTTRPEGEQTRPPVGETFVDRSVSAPEMIVTPINIGQERDVLFLGNPNGVRDITASGYFANERDAQAFITAYANLGTAINDSGLGPLSSETITRARALADALERITSQEVRTALAPALMALRNATNGQALSSALTTIASTGDLGAQFNSAGGFAVVDLNRYTVDLFRADMTFRLNLSGERSRQAFRDLMSGIRTGDTGDMGLAQAVQVFVQAFAGVQLLTGTVTNSQYVYTPITRENPLGRELRPLEGAAGTPRRLTAEGLFGGGRAGISLMGAAFGTPSVINAYVEIRASDVSSDQITVAGQNGQLTERQIEQLRLNRTPVIGIFGVDFQRPTPRDANGIRLQAAGFRLYGQLDSTNPENRSAVTTFNGAMMYATAQAVMYNGSQTTVDGILTGRFGRLVREWMSGADLGVQIRRDLPSGWGYGFGVTLTADMLHPDEGSTRAILRPSIAGEVRTPIGLGVRANLGYLDEPGSRVDRIGASDIGVVTGSLNLVWEPGATPRRRVHATELPSGLRTAYQSAAALFSDDSLEQRPGETSTQYRLRIVDESVVPRRDGETVEVYQTRLTNTLRQRADVIRIRVPTVAQVTAAADALKLRMSQDIDPNARMGMQVNRIERLLSTIGSGRGVNAEDRAQAVLDLRGLVRHIGEGSNDQALRAMCQELFPTPIALDGTAEDRRSAERAYLDMMLSTDVTRARLLEIATRALSGVMPGVTIR